MSSANVVLRPDQEKAVARCVEFLDTRASPRLCVVSPTGTGKSYCMLETLRRRPGGVIAVPGPDIRDGLAKKAPELADSIRTVQALRNSLLRGEETDAKYLVLDEAHHELASTWRDLEYLLSLSTIGFTATPYRGSPQATAEFKARWGEPFTALTQREAAKIGAIAVPSCRVEPLIDDDCVEIRNGEFVVSQVETMARDAFGRVAEIVEPFVEAGRWDRPTMIAVPSVAVAEALVEYLEARGLPAVAVTGDTSAAERALRFEACIRGRVAIVQVRVVGEGVDLPLRRLVDLTAYWSPVAWMQLFGRIRRPTGPGEPPPEYICCTRNLLRHAYLLEGLIPGASIKQAQDAFGAPSSRIGVRAFGFEGLGRLRATEFPCRDGLKGTLYVVSRYEETAVVEFAAIAHPLTPDVVWARRDRLKGTFGPRWKRIPPPDRLEGFASLAAKKVTEPQLRFWKNTARSVGLDDTIEPDAKQFAVLPILKDINMRVA